MKCYKMQANPSAALLLMGQPSRQVNIFQLSPALNSRWPLNENEVAFVAFARHWRTLQRHKLAIHHSAFCCPDYLSTLLLQALHVHLSRGTSPMTRTWSQLYATCSYPDGCPLCGPEAHGPRSISTESNPSLISVANDWSIWFLLCCLIDFTLPAFILHCRTTPCFSVFHSVSFALSAK